ncbi:MAG: ABC transporter ATP-binding protein [Pseudomonadota bacterium]
MREIVSIKDVTKVYKGGHQALTDVSLDIHEGEIFALLGPNGAGKTTLISAICGLISPSKGSVLVGGFDVVNDYRKSRSLIGLVPQEITLEPFEKVYNTVSFSRGLFGLGSNPELIERILTQLSLWDKKSAKIMELSGGMKRRVLIAKALSHEPQVLFLDEPTAGVDVELRKDMWQLVRELRENGVTIILTTHYIEEAEAIADRIGIINGGKLILAENKESLMGRLGRKQMRIELKSKITKIPDHLTKYGLTPSNEHSALIYTYDTTGERTGITSLLNDLNKSGIQIADIQTSQSSLEEIFVDLVEAGK